MNRSKLLNKYRKKKTEATRFAYKRQRYFCVIFKKRCFTITAIKIHHGKNSFLENRKTFAFR